MAMSLRAKITFLGLIVGAYAGWALAVLFLRTLSTTGPESP